MNKQDLIQIIQRKGRFNVSSPTSIEYSRFKEEALFFEENQGMYCSLNDILTSEETFSENKINSYIYYLVGVCDKICDFSKPLNVGKGFYLTRFSPPDVDIDFEDNRAVQEYAESKNGDKFVYVGTFSQWRPKAAIQNASKFNNFALPGSTIAETAIILSKSISKFDNDDFETAIESEEFKKIRAYNPQLEKIIDDARKICNQKCSIGKHAAGVIICDEPINQVCPYFVVEEVIGGRSTGRYIRTSQFDMKDDEMLGLLKADFLGLKTLQSNHMSVNMIKARTGYELILDDIDVFNKEDNEKVIDLFRKGITCGIFQFEGWNMTKFLTEMQPTCFDDLVAANALYRPGPKDNGYHLMYCDRKRNPQKAVAPHPCLKEILDDTYGLWVYQEQLMKGAGILADFSPTEQDELRRIIGKKQLDKLPQMKEKFISRCIKKGLISEELATSIWDQFERFGNYAFNRSHSASYSRIAYQTSYIKRFFPVEFYAGIMTRELWGSSSATDENSSLPQYEKEAEDFFNIKLLESDINYSKTFYNIEDINGIAHLRKPLLYITGVGVEAEKEIVAKQPYSSFEDFYMRHNTKVLNTKVVNALIEADAFKDFGTKDQMKQEYNRCKEIKDAIAKKGNSMKKFIPRMNGVI